MIGKSFDPDKMIAELYRDESVRLVVYDDATGKPVGAGNILHGHPTIGVGRCLDTHGISVQECRTMIWNDVTAYYRELSRYTWFTDMDAVRQRAIVNMRHQLGLHGLLQFQTMIAAIERHDWREAVQAGLSSLWAQQTPSRAQRVMLQLLHGDDLVESQSA
jgi:lysozyme